MRRSFRLEPLSFVVLQNRFVVVLTSGFPDLVIEQVRGLADLELSPQFFYLRPDISTDHDMNSMRKLARTKATKRGTVGGVSLELPALDLDLEQTQRPRDQLFVRCGWTRSASLFVLDEHLDAGGAFL